MAKLLTLGQFAKVKGVTLQAVQQAVEKGRVTCRVIDGKKRLDLKSASVEWDENTDPAARASATGGNSQNPTYAKSRADREAYAAKIAKLDYETKAGKLISVEVVKLELFELTRNARNLLLNIPVKISAEVAAEVDPHKVEKILDKEIRNALEALSAKKAKGKVKDWLN